MVLGGRNLLLRAGGTPGRTKMVSGCCWIDPFHLQQPWLLPPRQPWLSKVGLAKRWKELMRHYNMIYIIYIYILVFHGKCKTEGYSTYSSSSDDWQHVKRQSSHLDVSSALQHSHGCRHWVEGSILSHGTFIRWLETTLKDANSCHGLSLVAYSS